MSIYGIRNMKKNYCTNYNYVNKSAIQRDL